MLNTIPRPVLIRLSYVFKWFAPILLYGNNVECNVCNNRFKKFLPYGLNDQSSRDNVLCPSCLSLERHRLFWLYLTTETDFFTANKKVLHIAPEQCFYKQFKKQKNLDYTTGDLFSPLADIKFDLHDIPLANDTYDVVFCNHVLEHVENDYRCMQELYRILKPSGFAIMQVPIDNSRNTTYEDKSIVDPKEREKHFWQKDHVRLYGLDYPDKLRKAGFIVEENELAKKISSDKINRFRIHPEEMLYVARKE